MHRHAHRETLLFALPFTGYCEWTGPHSDLHPGSRTFCRISLATSYLDAGDVPRACDTAGEALMAAGRIKSARVRKYVSTFDSRLNSFGRHRSITEFRQQAREILSVVS